MSANRIRLQRAERILVVDDEPWTTELISEQLSVEGFQVDATNVSGRVMDILASRPYDLVILDIGMPPPDGMTLLKEILSVYPFMAVLMLTAFNDAETATQAMREGASDYIVKPHHGDQLVLRVERALERSRLLREREQAHQLLTRRVEEQTHKLREQSRQLAAMLKQVKVVYQATLKALEAALDIRDQSAPGHCRRVARLAVRLGKRMGLARHELVALEHGALLHDIGKLGIPDQVLMKEGPLTDEERRIMEQHPSLGCQIVSHIDFLKDALPIIRHHHEHYDGSGYPDGLKGEEIPLLARIFSVIDTFDALTSKRPYNKVCSDEDALQDLMLNKGHLFDPQVVDEFVAMIREQGTHRQDGSFIPSLDINGYLASVGVDIGREVHELQLQDEESR